jgi:hypothetical protein
VLKKKKCIKLKSLQVIAIRVPKSRSKKSRNDELSELSAERYKKLPAFET